ncbi:MAG: hypothetical protein IH586_12960, partial [Anaerolineaceae bacterium]|nr:hypothetical protein [Anaerolineaceae bacterium]
MNREYYREYRTSFFFPIALITVGVVWLLVNNGTIAMENVYRLAPYWPVLLILAGLSIVLNRLWWPLSSFLWLAAGAAVVWFLIYPPAFLSSTFVSEQRLETYTEKLGEAQSASVTLDLSLNPTRVNSLQDSADLIYASIYQSGGVSFSVSGAQQKTVRLRNHFNISPWNLGWQALSGQKLQSWEIGLTPDIPLDLT